MSERAHAGDHNAAALHEAIAAAVPDRECIVAGDLRLTWAQVTDRTQRSWPVSGSASTTTWPPPVVPRGARPTTTWPSTCTTAPSTSRECSGRGRRAVRGNEIVAVLSARAGADRPSDGEIRTHCRDQLAGYKVPKAFR